MSERRAGTKGRRMGSSRRKLLRESPAEAPAAAPSPGEESPWASEVMQKVQDFLKEQDKDQAGFITRSDMEKLQEENFPCSREEMELIFDGLDAAGTGRLSTEEFTAGLWQFLSSQKTARHHRRSKMASRRVRLVIPSPVLEGADSEERRHFAAFMEQLGTDNISEEQEIWQLWVKLRQDEPQLLGNLEDFLAKMRHRIQEARSKKEALELTLNKRVAEHDKEVQQLCQALEQQIQEEQQRLQQESVARGHQQDLELQQALDASEREVQRLVTAQKELEARCHSLHSTQQATSTENQQLEETNRVLEDHLQHLHQQLQETQERLQTARAAVAQGHAEEPRYRVVAELPSKTPLSPQTSLEKSEVYHSEMRIRLGSQSTKTKTKSIHQVVWEMPPAEVSFLGAQLRASSTEEDPFPELLKEEQFSDQSSLLREMNDAIAALNKQLKPQAPDAPPALAEAAQKPWSDVEPQMGSEAATGHGTPPRVRQETLSSHIGHEMFEGDLKEGPATAELHVPDVTQAGASMGAGHHRAQELGAEQGETLEKAWGMLSLQGKGSGVKEPMPKAAKDQQGAVGESMEAEEWVLLEGEGEGWMQEKTGWEKARLLGQAKEVALYQGEKLEVGWGPPEAVEAGLATGWQLGLAAAPEECVQPPRAGLGEEAGPPVMLSKEHEIHPGEHLEPEPPSQGEVRMGASQEDGVPKGTVAPGPGMLEEEHGSVELQPWGETLDAEELLAQHRGSRGAGVQEGEVEVTQPKEAELQPQGEAVRGQAGQGGSTGAEVLEEALELVGAEESQADTQLCGGPSPEAPRGGGDQAAMQDEDEGRGQGEHELPQEPLMVLHGTGLGQGDGSGAEEQPGAQADEFSAGRGSPAPLPVMTFGVQRPGVEVKGDVELPEEDGELELVQGEASKEDGLFLVKSQGLELAEAEAAQADRQLPGGASPEPPLAGEGPAVMQLLEEAGDGAQGQGECELLHEPELDLEVEGAPEGVQPWEEAESLAVLGDQSADANVQEHIEADKLKVTLGEGTETDLQPPSEAGSLDPEQGGSEAPDVQPLDGLDTPESVEKEEAEDAQEDTQLPGSPGPATLQGRGDHAVMQLVEEAGAGAQGQGECELLHEPELDLQGEGSPEGVQPWEEAESLAVLGDQSTDTNVTLLLEVDELKSSPGGGTEAALQLWSEQGASMAPDVQPLDELDAPESVEKQEAEDAQADRQLPGGASPEPPIAGESPAVMKLMEEAEDGARGQGECERLHEPELELDPQAEGPGLDVQPWEEAESLAVLGDQSTDANMQETIEADKLKVTLGGGTEADLQPPSEAGSLDPEQGGSEAPDVQPLDQLDTPELLEMREAEDSGQGGCELLHEPELDPQAEETGLDVQPWEEAVIPGMLEDQSTDANVSLLLELNELKSSPGGGPEAALQLWSEQGASMAPDVQPLDQLDTPESVEMREAEDAQEDTQLPGGASPATPLAEEGPAVMQLVEEAGDGADLAPLGPAGMREGEQSQTPGLEAGLHAAHTADVWEGAAGAHVCPPPEATLHPDHAAEGPGLSMMLGALTGADGQLPEDAQTLEIPQAEGADAEDRLLDGAQALEAVQGGRLEAGVTSLVGTQALGIKHGHGDDGLPALAPPVSKGPLEMSRLQLLMQEDVLVPDAWQLGGSGQAAQSELQEQVSAQRDKVKLHTASQQPQKPPHVMEREQVAARPAEPPKQEVPPASTLHTRVQQEEGAENEQLGMVLRNSSLRDEAITTVQPQRQLLEEQSKDLHAAQQEKQQELGWKMSREGGSSPGVPGPVTAAGAEAGQRSSPGAFLDPDHLYNVLFVGDSHVGKTSFLYRLQADAFNPHLTATVGLDYQVKNLVVDNKCFSLRLWDSAGQERYRSITKQYFRKADGVVLMYDITSEYSFSDVRYWLTCIQEGAEDGVGILLLGNKTDLSAERRVPTEEGERLAKEHQLMFYECSAASGHNVSESMVSFIRLLKAREDELKNKVVEEPRPPQKKKGCC